MEDTHSPRSLSKITLGARVSRLNSQEFSLLINRDVWLATDPA